MADMINSPQNCRTRARHTSRKATPGYAGELRVAKHLLVRGPNFGQFWPRLVKYCRDRPNAGRQRPTFANLGRACAMWPDWPDSDWPDPANNFDQQASMLTPIYSSRALPHHTKCWPESASFDRIPATGARRQQLSNDSSATHVLATSQLAGIAVV